MSYNIIHLQSTKTQKRNQTILKTTSYSRYLFDTETTYKKNYKMYKSYLFQYLKSKMSWE